MKLTLAHMSPDELRFIRLYCALLRKQYYEVKTVMALMNPSIMAVRSPVQASHMAKQLSAFGEDFDAGLVAVRRKHKIKEKRVLHDEVSFLNELADIFALSFFKVVAIDDETANKVTLVKDGWCSGEPTSWTKYIDLSEQPQDDYEKSIVSHILKFFSAITTWKKPSLHHKQVESDDERDEYDEDDDWYNDD